MSPGYYILYSEIESNEQKPNAGGPLCIKLSPKKWAVLGFERAEVAAMFQTQFSEPTKAFFITDFPSEEFKNRFYSQYKQVLLLNHGNLEMFLNNRKNFPYEKFLIPLEKPKAELA